MSNSIYLIGGNSLGRVKSSVLKFDGEKWTKIFQMASHLKDMGIFPTCNTEVIVYGGVDYSEIAPPKSYINVLPDFEKPKDLATFLTVRIIWKSWKVVKKKFEEQNKKQSIKNVYILNWDELRIQTPIFNFLYDNLLFGW